MFYANRQSKGGLSWTLLVVVGMIAIAASAYAGFETEKAQRLGGSWWSQPEFDPSKPQDEPDSTYFHQYSMVLSAPEHLYMPFNWATVYFDDSIPSGSIWQYLSHPENAIDSVLLVDSTMLTMYYDYFQIMSEAENLVFDPDLVQLFLENGLAVLERSYPGLAPGLLAQVSPIYDGSAYTRIHFTYFNVRENYFRQDILDIIGESGDILPQEFVFYIPREVEFDGGEESNVSTCIPPNGSDMHLQQQLFDSATYPCGNNFFEAWQIEGLCVYGNDRVMCVVDQHLSEHKAFRDMIDERSIIANIYPEGHGIGVTSVIGAARGFSQSVSKAGEHPSTFGWQGPAGTAAGSKVLFVDRALHQSYIATMRAVLEMVRSGAADDITVINCSWGYCAMQPELLAIIAELRLVYGIGVVAAVGNIGGCIAYGQMVDPGHSLLSLGVGGITENGLRWSESNSGGDVVALSEYVYAAHFNHEFHAGAPPDSSEYARKNGTSFASPIVAGAVHIILSNTDLGVSTTFELIQETASAHYPVPDTNMGYGIPDAYYAVDAAMNYAFGDGGVADVNFDRRLNADDIADLIHYMFFGGSCHVENTDVNGDGSYGNIADLSYLIAWTFWDGPSPVGAPGQDNETPVVTSLGLSNYPNPFNPTTTISFSLGEKSDYKLTVYNVTGQVVRSFEGIADAGEQAVVWDASSNSSGVYFYKLEAGDLTATKKMVLLK